MVLKMYKKHFSVLILVICFTSSLNVYAQFFNSTMFQQTNNIELLAGAGGGAGIINGVGPGARLNTAYSITIDTSGNLFVTDSGNHMIRKITPSAVVSIYAGLPGVMGSNNGPSSKATFNNSAGIAIDSSGNIFVADTFNNIIRKITPTGVVSTFAGSGTGAHADGTGVAASFYYPRGMAFDSSGNLFVADTLNYVIRKITPAGVVTTFAGTAGTSGVVNGTGTAAQFNYPRDLVIDSSNNIFVADAFGHVIRKITPGAVVTTFAGTSGTYGLVDNTGTAAKFNAPYGITIDVSNNLYVSDTYNNSIRKITPAGVVTTIAGSTTSGYADGTGAAAKFAYPIGITIDNSGNLFVVDNLNSCIRKITPGGVVTTFVGYPAQNGFVNGTGNVARFSGLEGMAIDSSGNTFVADSNNHVIRKITPSGVVTTFAGSGTAGFANGTGAAAQFNGPGGLAIDGSNNLYVADTSNHRIRKITSAGVVTTIAGSGTAGYANANGTSAQFSSPAGVAVNSAGEVFVAEKTSHIIRKIDSSLNVTLYAGTPSSLGNTDGAALSAKFYSPNNIAIDSSNNLYIADLGNYTIRKITYSNMTVSTLAGSPGVPGTIDGTGTAARFNGPHSLLLVGNNTLYVSDGYGHAIRKVTTAGVVTTTAGILGVKGTYSGQLPGQLDLPTGIATFAGKIYVNSANSIWRFLIP